MAKTSSCPNRNQQGGILTGRSYIVYLYEDSITGRCVATTKLKGFINNDLITVEPRQEVDLLVASESPIGYRVIVNNRPLGHAIPQPGIPPRSHRRPHEGIRPQNHRGQPYRREPPTGRICAGQGFGRGFAATGDRQRRHLPLNDDSSPEEVNRLTEMSKKVFKRSLGVLMKRGAVEVGEDGIKVKRQ